MLADWKFQWKLRQLQRLRRSLVWEIKKETDVTVDALTARDDLSEGDAKEALKEPVKEMLDTWIRQDREIADAIGELTTSFYVEEAERLMLPVPEHDDKESWRESKFSKTQQLTEKGLSDLRSAVRREKRERWEGWQMRLTLLIGLAGTLIGVIALLKK
jgi:hypothetical protein